MVDMTRSVSSIFVTLDGGWPMLTGSMHLTKESVLIFKLDHFLKTMEMKSPKKNLALRITILHLLCDPMIFKEGVQSLEGIQDYVV